MFDCLFLLCLKLWRRNGWRILAEMNPKIHYFIPLSDAIYSANTVTVYYMPHKNKAMRQCL